LKTKLNIVTNNPVVWRHLVASAWIQFTSPTRPIILHSV